MLGCLSLTIPCRTREFMQPFLEVAFCFANRYKKRYCHSDLGNDHVILERWLAGTQSVGQVRLTSICLGVYMRDLVQQCALRVKSTYCPEQRWDAPGGLPAEGRLQQPSGSAPEALLGSGPGHRVAAAPAAWLLLGSSWRVSGWMARWEQLLVFCAWLGEATAMFWHPFYQCIKEA